MNSFGPVHEVITVSGIYSVVANFTVQIRVTSDLTGTGLTGSLVTITDIAGGTVNKVLACHAHIKYRDDLYYFGLRHIYYHCSSLSLR